MDLTINFTNEASTRDGVSQEIAWQISRAEELIDIGQYEDACDALGNWWHGIGQRPLVEGLPEEIAAQLLLISGTLSSGLGSARGSGAEIQATAMDLISEARRRFLQIENKEGVAAADY